MAKRDTGAFTSIVSVRPPTCSLTETAGFSLSYIESHTRTASRLLLAVDLLLTEIWVCLPPKLLLCNPRPLPAPLSPMGGQEPGASSLVICAKPQGSLTSQLGDKPMTDQIPVLVMGVWEASRPHDGLYWCTSSQQTRYKESWSKLRDGGYKLRLDALPFQAAKASGEIISDVSIRLHYRGSV